MSSRGTSSSGGLDVDEAFERLDSALDALVSAGWWQQSEDALADAVVRLHAAEARIGAAQVGVISEAATRGLPGRSGATSTAAWVRGLVPISPGQAGARAALAERLPDPDLAPTKHALQAGQISTAHAGVLTRTMTAIDHSPVTLDGPTRTRVQDLLLDAARSIDPAQLGHAARRLRHRLDPDANQRLAHDEDAQHQAREAYLIQERTGMWLLHAQLPPTTGALLHAALDPLAAPRPATDGTPDPRPTRQRTADALGLLAELSLAARAGDPGALPRRHGTPTRLLVTADLETLTHTHSGRTAHSGGPGPAPGVLETGQPGGWDISPTTTQMLACDAEIIPVLTDPTNGRPLDVGDSTYPFPPRIRRAIEHRDQHCTWPGCTAPPPWCHGHHLIPFGQSRRTSEDNGTLLCGPHHRHVHTTGWTGHLTNGHVQWKPPDPNTPTPPANAHIANLNHAIQQLARQWWARHAQPPDTG